MDLADVAGELARCLNTGDCSEATRSKLQTVWPGLSCFRVCVDIGSNLTVATSNLATHAACHLSLLPTALTLATEAPHSGGCMAVHNVRESFPRFLDLGLAVKSECSVVLCCTTPLAAQCPVHDQPATVCSLGSVIVGLDGAQNLRECEAQLRQLACLLQPALAAWREVVSRRFLTFFLWGEGRDAACMCSPDTPACAPVGPPAGSDPDNLDQNQVGDPACRNSATVGQLQPSDAIEAAFNVWRNGQMIKVDKLWTIIASVWYLLLSFMPGLNMAQRMGYTRHRDNVASLVWLVIMSFHTYLATPIHLATLPREQLTGIVWFVRLSGVQGLLLLPLAYMCRLQRAVMVQALALAVALSARANVCAALCDEPDHLRCRRLLTVLQTARWLRRPCPALAASCDLFALLLLFDQPGQPWELCAKHQDALTQDLLHRASQVPQRMSFLDAPGGAGKPFLYRLLLATLRSQGRVELAVASSGIATLLMDGGRTAHFRFKIHEIRFMIHENSTCT
ncbi:hypothetical protein WJX72_010904 [[Myrmecia] bisecta]|uniref:ATP-dependent DNA helicase n=1 Tax=[Myrmecia] bisecta TaxID=41462 RepID=A0AAW1PY73_9CHLO